MPMSDYGVDEEDFLIDVSGLDDNSNSSCFDDDNKSQWPTVESHERLPGSQSNKRQRVQSTTIVSEDTPRVRVNSRKRLASSGVLEDIRLRVNSKERERMHDLNSAMNALRQVMPYFHGPSAKRCQR
jgi:hypothetical protein